MSEIQNAKGLSVATRNRLHLAGLTTRDEVAALSYAALIRLPSIGRGRAAEIVAWIGGRLAEEAQDYADEEEQRSRKSYAQRVAWAKQFLTRNGYSVLERNQSHERASASD